MVALNLLLMVAAVALLVPIVVLAVECFAAVMPWRGRTAAGGPARPRIAVLIPAHDEEPVIGQTLKTVLPQLGDGDRVIVVADNCSDGTARIARETGATVIERVDEQRRGKGYAIDFGVRYLEADPPDVVILVDADCTVGEGALDMLARAAGGTGRPVQAIYLMELPAGASVQDRVSAFAFRVKNLVRPMGAARLGMPCFLTGTGMGFPWAVIRGASVASGNIVEDMQLGIDLTIGGHAPLLCTGARVFGCLPQHRSAAVTQRTRWEHGHLLTIRTQVPRLLGEAFGHAKMGLLAMALDLCVPPLSFLVLFWSGLSVAILVAWVLGAGRMAGIAVAGGWVLLAGALLTAWAGFVRDILPVGALLGIPLYVLRKVPLYVAFWRRRQGAWVRTSRDGSAADNGISGGPTA